MPELREAETRLEHALIEACASKPANEADTGELIRVEEMLAIATDAAKRAVSLRRKRRADGGARGAQAALTQAEAVASPGAAHRVIRDERGATWDVFAVHPEPRPSPHSQLRGTFQQGWLCFDGLAEKRRLSPIPDDWQSMSDEQLAGLANRAEVVPRRNRPSIKPPEPPEAPREE
ncbi:MAG: hypothetical protein ABR499_02565 [Gemmatimonadaceae bacterium]